MKQIPGKMYLADQRGLLQTGQFRRYCTFNFGEYVGEDRFPFGSLEVVNEEMLAADQHIDSEVAQASHVVLLPITGALQLVDGPQVSCAVDVEEVLVCTLPAHHSFKLVNSYANDWIHFLQIRIKANELGQMPSFQHSFYNFSAIDNQLASIFPPAHSTGVSGYWPFLLSLGRFSGRQEAIYSLKNPGSGFFAFVISGAFEVEGRLLHEKDGLALWDTQQIDIEALSENAILLVLEVTHEVVMG